MPPWYSDSDLPTARGSCLSFQALQFPVLWCVMAVPPGEAGAHQFVIQIPLVQQDDFGLHYERSEFMDTPRHPQVVRTWKVERLKQRVQNRKRDPLAGGHASEGAADSGESNVIADAPLPPSAASFAVSSHFQHLQNLPSNRKRGTPHREIPSRRFRCLPNCREYFI